MGTGFVLSTISAFTYLFKRDYLSRVGNGEMGLVVNSLRGEVDTTNGRRSGMKLPLPMGKGVTFY